VARSKKAVKGKAKAKVEQQKKAQAKNAPVKRK